MRHYRGPKCRAAWGALAGRRTFEWVRLHFRAREGMFFVEPPSGLLLGALSRGFSFPALSCRRPHPNPSHPSGMCKQFWLAARTRAPYLLQTPPLERLTSPNMFGRRAEMLGNELWVCRGRVRRVGASARKKRAQFGDALCAQRELQPQDENSSPKKRSDGGVCRKAAARQFRGRLRVRGSRRPGACRAWKVGGG